MTNKIRPSRSLEKNSKKGDIAATFQLFSNYTNGDNVETKDADLATDYFKQCLSFFEKNVSVSGKNTPENKLSVDEVSFIDFRKFRKLSIKFEKDLTVLIGGNGTGKTTIADGVVKILTYFVASIEKEGKDGKRIGYPDINNESPHYADINARLSLGKNTLINGRLSRANAGAKEKRDSIVAELKFMSDIWRVVNEKQTINLPTFAFYSVARSHPNTNSSQSSSKAISLNRQSRFDAYTGALDGAGKFDSFIEWFIALHKKASNDKSPQIDSLKQQVEELELFVKDETNALWPLLQQKKSEYKNAQMQSNSNNINVSKYNAIVIKAITSVVPSINNIKVETHTGYDQVVVENDGAEVKLSQLSDGQRIFVALVADLARRMIMLNPNLDNPLEGQGIVLIDEIELHLHPKWQQEIIISLQKTFPNIQLIITTHSPQVLSTVDKRCIRRFTTDKDGNIITSPPKFQTKGVTSADILAEIMETNSIPDVIEAQQVNDFSNLLINGKRKDADDLLVSLIEHFSEDHPVIADCYSQIKIFEMKERIYRQNEGKALS